MIQRNKTNNGLQFSLIGKYRAIFSDAFPSDPPSFNLLFVPCEKPHTNKIHFPNTKLEN